MQALFIPVADGGKRFALLHAPADRTVRSAVLFVAPFAEELNKVRRMAALQARALAGADCAVLVLDLAGCGDSSGEFASATWQAWVDDVVAAAGWLHQRWPDSQLWLWGVRAGCLLAAEAAARLPQRPAHLWWSPVLQGRAHLAQFLRIRTAAEMLRGGAKLDLKAELGAGRHVDVAGYRLGAALAQGLGEARLAAPLAAQRVVWLDTDSRPDASPPPPAQQLIDALRTQGLPVQQATVPGPAFWQTTEIELAPLLLEATTRAVCGPTPAGAA